MNIAFSGHRAAICDEIYLDKIAASYPDATWVHGGAIGFDSQVGEYATKHNITQIAIRPDYGKYGSKLAPLKRNEIIVDQCDLLIACYDGRKSGGTYQTMKYATIKRIKILRVPPITHPHTTKPAAVQESLF